MRPLNGISRMHPLDGISRARPLDGISSARPMDGISSARPLDGISSARPLNGISRMRPLDGISSARPLDGISSARPLDGISSARPLDGISSARPLDGISIAHPLDGISSVRPLDGISSARPLDGISSVRPLDGISRLRPIELTLVDILCSNMKPAKRELPPTPETIDLPDKDGIILKEGYSKLEDVETPDDCVYDKLAEVDDSKEVNARLRAIEECQARFSEELRASHLNLLSGVRRLQDSVEEVMTLSINLQKSLVGSSDVTLASMDSLKKQYIETSHYLGERILEMRNTSERRMSAPDVSRQLSSGSDPKTRHSFDWEIQSADSLVKSQGQVSSQSYLIGNINYKVLGGVHFMKGGAMSVYLYGESIRPQEVGELTRCGRFNCKVSVLDRSGHMMDWVVGKVVGNFFKEKQWTVGDLNFNELKKKGYLLQGKHIRLSFVIDLLT
ncbi:hypothetical protein Btru_025563 [Bulinus truncatus]|nr:hypothetical protein Btru_025563 [Bulinus truncatus]